MFALSQRGPWVMKAAEKKVSLYDTTLRDGTQGEGFQLSGLDKLRIAHRLDEFGADYIEGGWPGSNPKDVEFFKAAADEEWAHARIRRELGFGSEDSDDIRRILHQSYRGSRYSFGYPACPNMADQHHLMTLLECDRIGLTMDESDQLHPEQSTTALVAYHPKAKYFNT